MKVAALAVSLACVQLAPTLARSENVAPSRHHPLANGGDHLITYAGIRTEFEGQGLSADAALLEYEWDFDGDGETDWASRESGTASHVYPSPGHFTATLRVTRLDGSATAVDEVRVLVRKGAGEILRIERRHRQRAKSRGQLEPERTARASRHRLSPEEAEFLEVAAEELPPVALPLPPDGNAKRYVVMINGGSETRFWEDVTFAYATFHTRYGIAEQDIFLLNYDGLNPSGLNPGGMIDLAATKANVSAVFTTLSGSVDRDDLLIVWVTDHGRGYRGPVQRSASQQKLTGYLDGVASVDPGDETDYLESDFKLRALFSGGNNIGGHGMNEWVVLDYPTSSIYYRHQFVSHFTDQYFAASGMTLSDNDIRVEEFIDYLAGDLNKDGKIAAGEVKDFDGDGVPPYDPVTRTFDEDDWGTVDTLVDNVRYVNTQVPEGWSGAYSIIDLGLDGRVDIDRDFDPAHPELADADGTDVDGDGLFDGLDVNDDGDTSDTVSVDETMSLYASDMTDDELSAMIDRVDPAATVVIMEQCFSGGFIWDLSRSGRIVMSASEEETVSYGNVFIRNVNAALEGSSVPGSSGDPALADTNHDGIVDLAEAFQFASSNDVIKPSEIPQYDDNGDGVSSPDPIPAGGDGPLGSHTSLVQWGGDLVPPLVIDVQATNVTSSSASISWATAEPATSQVEFGTDVSYGQTTSFDPTLKVAHTVPLAGLASLTTYHYRVRSQDAYGNSSVSEDFAFRTAAPVLPSLSIESVTITEGSDGTRQIQFRINLVTTP